MRLKMAEENRMKRRGLGGKGRKEADPEPTVSVAEESQTVPTTKPLGKRIVLIILVAIISFGAVGAVVWTILHNNQKEFAKVAEQSSKLSESVAKITEGIPEAKSLESLDKLNVKATEAIKDFGILKTKAQSIGDDETSRKIELELAKVNLLTAQLKPLIDRESKAVSAIGDIEKSVQPFTNVEKLASLNCVELSDTSKKFDEANQKLKDSQNVPIESFAHKKVKPLTDKYDALKRKVLDLTTEKCVRKSEDKTDQNIGTGSDRGYDQGNTSIGSSGNGYDQGNTSIGSSGNGYDQGNTSAGSSGNGSNPSGGSKANPGIQPWPDDVRKVK